MERSGILPHQVDRKIREYYQVRREKDGKERRVYTKECKAKAIALAEKQEKPVARDLGIRNNVLHKSWIKRRHRRRTYPGQPIHTGTIRNSSGGTLSG
jgi:transposase-like protein